MVHRRRLRGDSICWLRRKRSENELSSLANVDVSAASAAEQRSVPDVPYYARSRTQRNSIWNHALLEPDEAVLALNSLSSHTVDVDTDAAIHMHNRTSSWAWSPRFDSLATPVPSTLSEIACFASQQRGAAAGASTSAGITCGLEFEEHGWLLATADTAKQVKVYSIARLLEEKHHAVGERIIRHSPETSTTTDIGNAPDDAGFGDVLAPLRVHRLASKLSSLGWNPDQPGVVTLGDYDGCVLQLDLETGHVVAEVDQHDGRRVWSVSHSHLRPHLVASGSEDGTVALWAGQGLQHVAARIGHSGGPSITSVHLSPFDEHRLAVARSDATAAVYDVRSLETPVAVLRGHSSPASYVKFFDRNTVVTAATDARLGLWRVDVPDDVPCDATTETLGGRPLKLPRIQNHASAAAVDGFSSSRNQRSSSGVMRPAKTYQGHVNSKNFVGLSVRPEERLLACGSETSAVFAYCTSWAQPLAQHPFMKLDAPVRSDSSPFCSAVAWQPASSHPGPPLLAAATSDGAVRLLALSRSGPT
jgi:E3 ubiquitin-protein ligase RFWD2